MKGETNREDIKDMENRYNARKLECLNTYNIKVESKNIPKENIIDLTFNTANSPTSDGRFNNIEQLPILKNVYKTEESKISLGVSSDNINSNPNYEDLIAKDMGTTANILLIKNNHIYLANVGDSLAVLYKNGIATRLNQEHKTTLASEYSRISKSGSKVINNRIEGRINLTRAIGRYKY
jgi:serine/threonine protein phosphatase PrpC